VVVWGLGQAGYAGGVVTELSVLPGLHYLFMAHCLRDIATSLSERWWRSHSVVSEFELCTVYRCTDWIERTMDSSVVVSGKRMENFLDVFGIGG